MITRPRADPNDADEIGLEYQCEMCGDWYYLYLHSDRTLTDGRTVCKHCFRSHPELELKE
jgi:formylmethanofuran dehydrogenase subunit E